MEKVRPWCGQPSDGGRLKNIIQQHYYYYYNYYYYIYTAYMHIVRGRVALMSLINDDSRLVCSIHSGKCTKRKRLQRVQTSLTLVIPRNF